jgi:superfamily II DNA/RNA helicase
MSFKKLTPLLKESLNSIGHEAPTLFQKAVLPKLKGGANIFGIAPKDSGKTDGLIISTIQKLNAQAYQDSPRALIFVKDKKAALELESNFKRFTRRTDLRVYAAYDEYNIDFQKDEIYYGQDIIITTPKRLSKLYLINGIHLGEVQFLAIEDAQFLAANNLHADIIRLSESIKKCQYAIFADKYYPKFKKFESAFMSNSQLIEL